MNKDIEKSRVAPGKKFALKDYDTGYNGSLDKESAKLELDQVKEELDKLQETLYAADSQSVLVIFQAMDAAGKDSAIAHVMSGLNPQGCQVYSFKTPTSEEYDHDFLWRHYKALPERGRLGIHNRSHYENVLVCKVHPEYVLKEKIPSYDSVKKLDDKFWKRRYESIRNFEKHITDNGTVVIKFFLYVSKDEQKARFLERIENPVKNWKFSSSDITEREKWGDYMEAYEQAINETTTDHAPWYVIPADKKWYARLLISQILEHHVKGMNLKFPVLGEEEMAKLEEIQRSLLLEG